MSELTSFVYKLSFGKTDLCYIGQARVPLLRFDTHVKKLMRGRHDNNKMQLYYNEHKVIPTMSILIEVDLKRINIVEEFYIRKHRGVCFNISMNTYNFDMPMPETPFVLDNIQSITFQSIKNKIANNQLFIKKKREY